MRDVLAQPLDGVAYHADIPRMTLSDFPRISVDPSICGGRPIVTGTRMRVSDILDMLAGGATETEIVGDFPYIAPEDVQACLRFAARSADHPIVTAAE